MPPCHGIRVISALECWRGRNQSGQQSTKHTGKQRQSSSEILIQPAENLTEWELCRGVGVVGSHLKFGISSRVSLIPPPPALQRRYDSDTMTWRQVLCRTSADDVGIWHDKTRGTEPQGYCSTASDNNSDFRDLGCEIWPTACLRPRPRHCMGRSLTRGV